MARWVRLKLPAKVLSIHSGGGDRALVQPPGKASRFWLIINHLVDDN
jgi:hypothetical protein